MMQKILLVINAAPYGSERCRSALRVALSLADRDQQAQVRLFLMSDATTLALPNQEDAGERTTSNRHCRGYPRCE